MTNILKHKNYIASVYYSADDEVFFGKILGINDLVSFEGSSVKALKSAFKEAIEDYLDTCAAANKEPDKTYKGTFNVRVPSTLHKQAALFAATNNITLNEFMKLALSYTLKHGEQLNRSIQEENQLEAI